MQSGHTSFKEFLEGQQTFLKKKEKRIQQKYEEKLKTEESTPSFQPQLNKTSRNVKFNSPVDSEVGGDRKVRRAHVKLPANEGNEDRAAEGIVHALVPAENKCEVQKGT